MRINSLILSASALIFNHHTAFASEAVIPPFISAKVLFDGVVQDVKQENTISNNELSEWKLENVYGCCTSSSIGECPENTKHDQKEQRILSRPVIGNMPQFTTKQALHALQSAVQAWDGGSGQWPQMSLSQRIDAVKKFLTELHHKRQDIANVLMWEIGKNRNDAEAEFDRTIQFAEKTIEYILHSKEFGNEWDQTNGSVRLFLRRAAIGIVLCLGPYNYPLNETYAALIPALLMGNVVILKIPTVGGLVHLLTMEAFAKAFPPGVVHLVSGSGRILLPSLMQTGKIDSLAFIGGSHAADDLIRSHPEPHRLKVFLQLEAKNMGIFMPDLFVSQEPTRKEEEIVNEAILGTLSFNGQRCTALKLLFFPRQHAQYAAELLASKVEKLLVGLPWETRDGSFSQITPLPNKGRIDYMKTLINDAVDKGATIMNKDGGTLVNGGDESESTLMIPAVLYPVTPEMMIYQQEQFGPIVPIAPYDSLDEILRYAQEGRYAQQVSIFTSSADDNDTNTVAQLIDRFSTVFGKININSQCGRSPDTAPFSGRRSSAMGVMSVMDALHQFSIPTVLSYKDEDDNYSLIKGYMKHSNFLLPVQ